MRNFEETLIQGMTLGYTGIPLKKNDFMWSKLYLDAKKSSRISEISHTAVCNGKKHTYYEK